MNIRSRVLVAAVFGALAVVIADDSFSSTGWHGTRWRDCSEADSRRCDSRVLALTWTDA